MKEFLQTITIVGLALITASSTSQAARVILLKDTFPGSSERLYDRLRDSIASDEHDLNEVDVSRISSALDGEKGYGAILVLPNAVYFPADAKTSLAKFLKRGNHLIALSGPSFKEMVVENGAHWLTKAQAKDELAHADGEEMIDFGKEDLSTWHRYAGTQSNKAEQSIETASDPRIIEKALHVSISKLDDWETYVSRPLAKPFPANHTATVFWAKGGIDTPELVVEWREKDSSRWMAVVKLAPEWNRYALTPGDFRFWGDGSPGDRGKPGDQFNPANAEAVSFGLANGISRQKMGIAHEFWVADLRAAEDPYRDVDFASPLLESLSPSYKTHSTTAKALRLLYCDEVLPAKTSVIASIPRSPGFGCDGVRRWRLIPIVQALGDNNEIRGSAAHIFVNSSGDYAGSVWGYVGLTQDYLTNNLDKTLQIVSYMLERMSDGVFFSNAGTEHFAYAKGEDIKCGAYLINLGNRTATNVDTVFQVLQDDRILASDYVRTVLGPHSEPTFVDGTAAIRGKMPSEPGLYTVKMWASVDGKVVDGVSHEFRIIEYKPLSDQDTVSTRDGDFYLNRQKWYPLGINYWPRYATGLEQGDYWLHWLAPVQYNPEVIEADLTLAEKLGMNLVSIQYTKPDQARPLMDFMARAQKHGIKVHAYLPGLHPLDQNFPLADDLIARAHLSESPALFAYDVGWEVHIGKYDSRKLFDNIWQDWVVERYGSVESAENDWGYKPDRVSGVITGPIDAQLLNDGEWRVYVAAYRRFWDDEISKRYMSVRNNIESVDPYHLIGSRSGYGGTGFLWNVPDFAFDLRSGVKHLDFTSPEAYGLGGDRVGFIKGGLNTLYGRFVSGGKPVYWAEYGMSIWPQCNAEVLEEARSYYESILDMTYRSNANGSAGWWWPGGFRLGENSDFGIINPDGTPRPAALEIQKFAPRFTEPRQLPEPDFYLTIDRDKYVTGYPGIFTDRFKEYVDALENGKVPGLKTEGTGTTSANAPLVAVGNVPYNGHNPAKYLNAEFNYVKINGALVHAGQIVEVQKGRPVIVEVSVGNTGDATWVPVQGDETGSAALLVRTQGNSTSEKSGLNSITWSKKRGNSEQYCFITKDAPYLSDAVFKAVEIPEGTTHLTMRMAAFGRIEFGEVFEATLVYR